MKIVRLVIHPTNLQNIYEEETENFRFVLERTLCQKQIPYVSVGSEIHFDQYICDLIPYQSKRFQHLLKQGNRFQIDYRFNFVLANEEALFFEGEVGKYVMGYLEKEKVYYLQK